MCLRKVCSSNLGTIFINFARGEFAVVSRLTFYVGFMIAHLLLSVIKSSFNRALIKVSLNFDIKVASVTNVGLVQVNGAIRNLTSSPTRHRPANNLFLLSLTCNFETPLRF